MPYTHDPNDITPQMTANNAPSPNVASARDEASGPTYAAWKAFDHLGYTDLALWIGSYPGNLLGGYQWLEFNFGAGNAKVVNRYKISDWGDNPEFCCKDFKLQAYDGAVWVDLDVRTGVHWGPVGVSQTQEFTFTNTTAYERYRLYITALDGGAYGTYIAELELFYDISEITLVVNDLSHADGIGAVALTQVHNLAVNALNHANAIDNIVLNQIHQLAVQALSHTHSIDAPALTQIHQLVVQALNHSQTLDGLILSQIHNLLVQDLSHAHGIDNVGLYSILYDLLRPLTAESREETISAPRTRRVFKASHRRREFS